MAYRSSVHDSTGFTPNQMMFGRDVKLPLDLVMGPPPELYESSEEYVHELRRHMKLVHDKARVNLKIASASQKKQYDHRSKRIGFAEGDLVWYYCSARKRGLSPKLQKRWTGPYTISRRISDILYEIKMSPSKRRPIVVHCDKLRAYTSGVRENPEPQPKMNNNSQSLAVDKQKDRQTRSGRTSRPPQWYGIPSIP